jgi:4-hydroxybenzoate polyprenyltransferase
MRLPNVFTAVADVAMGYLIVERAIPAPARFACLVAASACLYIAGMVLNDVFDIEVDRKERGFRPLPSGQIGSGTARAFGFMLLALGIAFGWLAGYADAAAVAIPWRSGAVATILAGCVLLYDAILKRTPIGPLGMGLCRFFNVLLGMSAASHLIGPGLIAGFTSGELLIAAGIGVYIVGVTWFSRSEAAESQAMQLGAATAVMLAGAVVLGFGLGNLPGQQGEQRLTWVWLLVGLLLVSVLRRTLSAVTDPSPERVQVAVKQAILSLIWLDAAAALAVAPPIYAVSIATLLIPALLLGRWVYST